MKKLLLPLLLLLAFGMLLAVESAPSAVVGYVKYPVVAGNNFIALPMSCPWTMASEVAAELGAGNVDQVSYYNTTDQTFLTAVDLGGFWLDDFEVGINNSLLVYSYVNTNFYSLGTLPAAASFSLVSGNNAIMIPLNRSDLTMASSVGLDIGEGTVDQVSYYNPTDQTFLTAVDLGGFWLDDYETSIAMPLLVYSYSNMTWPNRSGSRQTRSSKTK